LREEEGLSLVIRHGIPDGGPPASHQRSPAQVLAAISSDLFSYPLAGSPGVVAMRHTCLRWRHQRPTRNHQPSCPNRWCLCTRVRRDARRTGDTGDCRVETGRRLPHWFPGRASRAIIRQSPCQRTPSFPHRNATIGARGEGIAVKAQSDLWVISPAYLSGGRIDRRNPIERCAQVNDAVDDDRFCREPIGTRDVGCPGKTRVATF